MSVKLTLLRHGETKANRENLVLGTSDVGLTNLGKCQAHASALRISNLGPDAIYTSPYTRAIETAQYISRLTGLNPNPMTGLQEMDSGEMEGTDAKRMEELFPEYMARWEKDASTTRPPGGETLGEVHSRAWKSALEISRLHENKHIVIVTHMFPIQGILCNAMGLHSNQYNKISIDLGSISSVSISGTKTSVLNVNSTQHLENTYQSLK